NDMKLQQLMKKQNLTKKHEIGEFCDQFSYDTKLQYPHKIRKQHRSKTSRPYRKRSSKKSSSKNKTPEKPTKKRKSSKKKDKSKIECYKCGKTGHFANKCKSKLKQKLNEMSLDEDIQQQIINCLATSSSESCSEDGLAKFYSESDNDSDNEQCQTCIINNRNTSAEADYWKAIVEMNGLDVGSPSINVLTDTQKSLLDFADNIKEPEIKLKFLEICYKN
ncbi:MAG TPA: C2HC-type zinc finger protein, partial [Chryseobacterium sp.]